MKRTSWIAAALVAVLGGPAAVAAGADPARPTLTAAQLAREIDRLIDARLEAAQLQPAPRADDADFLRRAWLDLAGVIPPAEQAAAYLADKGPGKRTQLIEQLLASPRHGQRQADVWLVMLAERDSANEPVPFQPLHGWLAERFQRNQPWDRLVHDLLTASGTQQDSSAATFFLANPAPEQLVDRISRVFLGTQMQCAQCHDHPFSPWKREEYWALAGYFTALRYQGLRPTIGMTSVRDEGPGNPFARPESYLPRAPRVPRGQQPPLDGPPRPAFVQWLTAPDNPFFARAMCNRVWAQFLGRGLVEPVDNMQDGPSHPELLDLLTEQFIANRFDLRYLVRALCLSETYQRTATGADPGDARLYQRMAVRSLSPEQLYDSLAAVIGEHGRPMPGRGRLPPRSQREIFIDLFRVDGPDEPTAYRAGIPQALRLMNATPLTSRNVALVRQAAALPADQAVARLFQAALSRPPTAREQERFTPIVSRNSEEGCSAVLWALINCSEFTLNR